MAKEPIALYIPNKHDVLIERDDVTFGMQRKLQRALNDIKKKHNPYSRTPRGKTAEFVTLDDGTVKLDRKGNPVPTGKMRDETDLEWTSRVIEELEKQYARLPDEKDDAYDARVEELNLQDNFFMISFDFVCAVCNIFSRELPTIEDWESINVERARVFCYDLLAEARIEDPTGLFFPRRSSKEIARAFAQGGN